jgi:hypothetical protein
MLRGAGHGAQGGGEEGCAGSKRAGRGGAIITVLCATITKEFYSTCLRVCHVDGRVDLEFRP